MYTIQHLGVYVGDPLVNWGEFRHNLTDGELVKKAISELRPDELSGRGAEWPAKELEYNADDDTVTEADDWDFLNDNLFPLLQKPPYLV